MPNPDYAAGIQREIDAAREALRAGHQGRARVCARRAAGNALAWLQTRLGKPQWGSDALHRLQGLNADPDVPPGVAAAAGRLIANISKQFTYGSSEDPLQDALRIIAYVDKIMEG